MVTQKMISVRIDLGVLDALDKEVAAIGIPRNLLINRAAKNYLELVDIIRAARIRGRNTQDTAAFIKWLEKVEDKKDDTWGI